MAWFCSVLCGFMPPASLAGSLKHGGVNLWVGCRYTIIRPTGLIREADPDDGKAYTLELSQGDVIAGRVSREEVADVVAAALQEPAAAGATFELRRTERWSVGGPASFTAAAAKVEFLKLVKGVCSQARWLVRRCRRHQISTRLYCSRHHQWTNTASPVPSTPARSSVV